MITTSDPAFSTALNTLKVNHNLSPLISEMESAAINVFIKDGSSKPQSQTDARKSPTYYCYINPKGDDVLTLKKWGIKGTTEVNSIAHELGHLYWDYLLNIKKKKRLLDGQPKELTADQWSGILSEATSRRFDNYSRPPGTIIPTADTAKEE